MTFALDMLAIPATSSECERVFSSAKLLITASRNRLLPDIIEANECLKAWFGKPEEKQGREKRDDRTRDSNDWGSGSDEESSEQSSEEAADESLGEDNDSDEESESDA